MEYINLFKATDILLNKSFRCVIHRNAGEIHFPTTASYLMVFMLQGDMEVTPPVYTTQKISAGHLIVIKPQTLRNTRCSENTILLEYSPPQRLCDYFDRCSSAFQMPCSTIIPILPPLQEWIDTLLSTYMQSEEMSSTLVHEQRRTLAKVLLKYPNHQLSELFVPFMFCAQGSCDECLSMEATKPTPVEVG